MISRQLIRQTLETALVAARQGRHSSMTSQCMPGMGIDTAIFKLHRYIQVIVAAIYIGISIDFLADIDIIQISICDIYMVFFNT